MEKNQKILKFLSYFTIIWNSVALAFKIVFLTLLLLLTFVCAKNISLSNEVADAINNAVVENVTPDTYNDTFSENSTQDNKGFKPIPDSKHIEKGIHFSYNGTDFNVNKDFSMSKVSGSDIQNLSVVFAVILIIAIVWTIFTKFLVIYTGALGLRASKKPEKSKVPFVLACVISVFSAIKIILYVLFSGIGFVCTVSSIVFIIFTVYLGVVKKDYENTLKESSPQSDNNTTEVINNTTEETVENGDLENRESE